MSIANRRRWVRRNRLNAAECLESRLLLAGAPIINEFVASNTTGLLDEDGDASDWFEVYNPTTEVIDLKGWYATDDSDRLRQWEFPEVSIGPSDFLVVFASNKDRATAGRESHTNFNLAASGESLLLVEPDGQTVASKFNPYPSQREDISYGISHSIDAVERYFLEPTPGTPNGEGVVGFVSDVQVSHQRRFFSDPITVQLSTATPDATIRFTTDSSLPTEENGTIYSGPMTVSVTTTLRVAAFKDGFDPSVTETHTYIFLGDVLEQGSRPQAAAGNFAITEINYHPHQAMPEFGEANSNDNADFEFIELQNIGVDNIELGSVKFIEGILFNFADQVLGPGQRIVIPRDKDAFVSRYGDAVPLALGDDGDGKDGVFAGKLSNGGELLILEDADGKLIQELTFSDDAPWSQLPDGEGSSLEISDVMDEADDPYNWRPSGRIGGSPGSAGHGFVREVVINEILTHTDLPVVDVIELRNTTELPIDVSGWYVSDAGGNLRKYQIPHGTVIPGGGFLLLNEDQLGFGFRGQQADNAYLVQSDANGQPIFFSDYVEFSATQNGVTLGRWPDSSGDLYPMISPNLGDDNSGPHLAHVIISEVQYKPDLPVPFAESREFVEVTNRGPSPLNVGSWQLAGAVQFTLPIGTAIGAGESLVFVSFDPIKAPAEAADFRNTYASGDDVRLLGPYSDADRPNPDSLRDGGETIILQRPEDIAQLGLGYVLVDRVAYDDTMPWPAARGSGNSLNRRTPIQYGDSASSWQAETPTPGRFQVDTILGDLNGDQWVDASDIDALALAIRTDQGGPAFDLDGDGWVDDGDLQFLVGGILNTLPGDADLSGRVEFSDFLVLAANFGRAPTGWSEGNFDTDPLAGTEFSDFLLLAANFGFTRAVAPVIARGVWGDIPP